MSIDFSIFGVFLSVTAVFDDTVLRLSIREKKGLLARVFPYFFTITLQDKTWKMPVVELENV